MPKHGQRDLSKEEQWRRTFTDWDKTGLSGAKFCRQRGIIYSQFKDWQKKIRRLDAEIAQMSRILPTRQRRIVGAAEPLTAHSSARALEFAEVQVADPSGKQQPLTAVDRAAKQLEIVLATGTTIRLTAGCPVDWLSSLIASLEEC